MLPLIQALVIWRSLLPGPTGIPAPPQAPADVQALNQRLASIAEPLQQYPLLESAGQSDDRKPSDVACQRFAALLAGRVRVPIVPEPCAEPLPCLVQTRRAGTAGDAIPADRALLHPRKRDTAWFLAPVRYLLSAQDLQGARPGTSQIVVKAAAGDRQ